MMLPTVLSAATFAVAAQAFLLPLEVVETAELSKSLAPFVSQSQELDLDCSACPFALESTRNGLHEWTASQKSDLKLNFATADGKLRLNGVPFYPINFPELPPVLSVKQVAKKDDDETSTMVGKAFPGDLSLSYSLEVNDIKHFANPDEEEADLVSVVMSIMGLDDQMVQVDDIHIKLLKGADSALHIIDVFPVRSAGQDSQCATVMCRFFAKLNAGMGRAKAAAQSAATKAGQKVRICCLRCLRLFRGASHHGQNHNKHHQHGAHDHPLHMRPNGASSAVEGAHDNMSPHEDGHSLVLAFLTGVRRGFTFVLFPMLAGIAFGVVASAVGMLVGQLVVFLWVKFRPAREGGYERVEDVEKDDELPAYEDVEARDVKENEKA